MGQGSTKVLKQYYQHLGPGPALFILIMSIKVRNWCFTLNNYVEAELVSLCQRLSEKEKVRYAIFGKEVGKEGTHHLQGYVSFSRPQRLTAVKKVVGDRAHVEISKGTEEQNIIYCSKGEQSSDEYASQGSTGPNYGRNAVVQEFGTRKESGKRSDLDDFKDAVKDGVVDHRRLLEEHSHVCAKYPRFVQSYIRSKVPLPEIEDFTSTLRAWQQRCLDIISTPPDPRMIIFVYDEEGNAGKSWLAQWLLQEKEFVQVMKPGKIADMAYEYNEYTQVFILDCPRSKQGDVIQYDFLENIKDGMLFSPKYESVTKRFKPPHVFVFMNEMPNLFKLSHDRYFIIDHDDNIIDPTPRPFVIN